jgi:hypothetical protein
VGERYREKITRSSIEWANTHNKSTVAYHKGRARTFAEDPNKEKRLAVAECIVCHGGSRIGGAACTSRQCGLCSLTIHSGNTCVDVLCMDCAKANGLCKHCGGDIDMKDRRKPRPFETAAKPEDQ